MRNMNRGDNSFFKKVALESGVVQEKYGNERARIWQQYTLIIQQIINEYYRLFDEMLDLRYKINNLTIDINNYSTQLVHPLNIKRKLKLCTLQKQLAIKQQELDRRRPDFEQVMKKFEEDRKDMLELETNDTTQIIDRPSQPSVAVDQRLEIDNPSTTSIRYH